MDLARFQAVLDAYGADARGWPEGERAAMLALLQASPEAQAAREAVAELDRLLATSAALAPSAALVGRIMAAAPSPRREARTVSWAERLWPFGPAWRPALALVMAPALGLAAGLWLTGLTTVAVATDDGEQLAFSQDAGGEQGP